MDSVIREFWREKAKGGTTRWTGDDMLAFDRSIVGPEVPPKARILDLGSGFGELSTSVTPVDGQLLAVDAEPGMAPGFAGDSRFRFEVGDVAAYRPDETFDVVLLFGVVTHLTPEQEVAVYDTIHNCLADEGVAIIKNQCSDGASFVVDTVSKELGGRYVGRYPSIEEQSRRLAQQFESVNIVEYPPNLKMHDNSSHVAFFCRRPKRS